MNPPQRYLALDVLRVMTVCFMIIVNTPGSYDTAYAPLNHASWHGFTPTDLVFPTFMFVVGNALSFVVKKWETLSDAQVVGKIIKRTLILRYHQFLKIRYKVTKIHNKIIKNQNWMISVLSLLFKP